MSWIDEIEPESADGQLRSYFDRMQDEYDMEPNVLSVLSLYPEAMRDLMNFGKTVLNGPGPLPRKNREMLAVRVSSINECHY